MKPSTLDLLTIAWDWHAFKIFSSWGLSSLRIPSINWLNVFSLAVEGIIFLFFFESFIVLSSLDELSFLAKSLISDLFEDILSDLPSDKFVKAPSFFLVVSLELFGISWVLLFLLGSIFIELYLLK